jgi:hypothetical protein
VSSASMKVASVTVIAMAQGFARGRHVSWNVGVAAAANEAIPPGAMQRSDGGCCRHSFGARLHQLIELGPNLAPMAGARADVSS